MISVCRTFWQWLRRPHKSKIEQFIETIIIFVPLAFVIRTFFYGLYQVPSGSMETTMLIGERFFADKLTIWFRPLKHGDIIAFNDVSSYHYSDNYLIELFQRYVYGPMNVTKRIIGLPGDHVKGVIEEGKPVIYRNGEKLEESYINRYPLVPLYRNNTIMHASYDANYSYEQQPFYWMDSNEVELGKRWATIHHEDTLLMPGSIAYDHYGRNVDIFDIQLGPDQYWVMGDNRLGSADSRFWGPLSRKFIHGKIILRLWSIDSSASWWILDLILHPIEFWKHMRWSRFFQWIV